MNNGKNHHYLSSFLFTPRYFSDSPDAAKPTPGGCGVACLSKGEVRLFSKRIYPEFKYLMNKHFMNKHWLLALLLPAALLTSCHNHDSHADEHDGEKHEEKADKHNDNDIILEPEEAKAAGVATERVSPSAFSEVITVSGQIMPAAGGETTITATMAGIVKYAGKAVTEGEAVGNGQGLFVVSAQQMANGNPAAAAAAELRAAKQEYERAKALANDRLISARELEAARQRYETATATAESLGGSNQSRMVASNMNGYVKEVLVRPGDYVSAGQPLATVAQSRRLQLRAEVPERHYAMLPNITGANFRFSSGNDNNVYALSSLNGQLVSRGKSAETGDFFVPVIFEFNNVGHLVSGTFVEVYLLGRERQGVISIPVTSLTEEQGVYYVYLRTSDHSYRKAEVKLGGNNGQRVEILSGLKAGEEVVTRGAIQVKLAASSGAIPEGHNHEH